MKLLRTLAILFFCIQSSLLANQPLLPSTHYTNDRTWFEACLANKPLVAQLKKIKFVVSDIDGCLNDGNSYHIDPTGEAKGISNIDGLGMHLAMKAGLHVGVMSGLSHAGINRVMQLCGIPSQLRALGVPFNKAQIVQDMQKHLGVAKEETLYFGDDVVDAPAKPFVGLFIAPHSAPFYMQGSVADLVVPKDGGTGALRLLLDLILYIQQKHFATELITVTLNKKT